MKRNGGIIVFIALFISCADSTVELPILFIHGSKQVVDSDVKVPCFFSYTDIQDSLSFTRLSGKAKRRGGMSRMYPKRNFSIELNEAISLGALPRSKHWILNACYIDKTFIRHKFAYDLFRSFDMENIAPLTSYLEVNMDDTYNGLYLLSQKMDKTTLKLDIEDSMACVFKEPTLFKTDTSKILLKQKYPKLVYHDQAMKALRHFIIYSTKEAFGSDSIGIFSYLDIQSIIDWHILLLFTRNGDGLEKSFYLYRRKENEKYRICPWDYDHSLGRDGDGEKNLSHDIDMTSSRLFRRLLAENPNEYLAQVKSRYRKLRRHQLSKQKVIALVESLFETVRPYVPKNQNKWSYAHPLVYKDEATFEEEEALIKNWLDNHLVYMDSLLNTY